MFISVIMIAVTVLFAAASPFALRAYSSAQKIRVTGAVLHIAVFEIIAVIVLEIARTFYLVNQYVSNSVNPEIFRGVHTAVCSVLAVCAVLFTVLSLRSGKLCRSITFGVASLLGAALSFGGYFVLRAVEAAAEQTVGKNDAGMPIVIGDGLTNEYSSVALPVLIGAALCIIFAAANLLLDTEPKWMLIAMTAVNIITVAVYAIAFVLMLGVVSEIADGNGVAVYGVALFGIIFVLPPIICMCSAFSGKIEKVNNAARAKKK